MEIPIDAKKARDLCGPGSWRAGQEYAIAGAVSNTWKTENGLHAEVQGSSPKPYSVALEYKELELKPRCSCPAYRRNPFCKHVAALMAVWLDNPERFVEGQAAPQIAEMTEVKRKRSGKAKAPTRPELIATGLDTLETFLADLANHGLFGLSSEQVENMGQVAGVLEGYKLPRLARLLRQLQERLAPNLGGSSQNGRFDRVIFSNLLAEMWLTISATRKALANAEVAPGILENLTGKTLTEKELEPLENLRLLELYYEARLDEEGFNIYSSIFLDLRSGNLYNERQIVPGRLANITPKPSYDYILKVKNASLYPGYEPRRIKLVNFQTQGAPTLEDWQQAQKVARKAVAELFNYYQAQKSDPLHKGRVPVLFSPKTVLITGSLDNPVWLEDEEGKAIPVMGAPLLLTWLKLRPVAGLFGELHFRQEEGKLYFSPLSFFSLNKGLVRL